MSIESEIFKRRIFLPEKLLNYGFKERDNTFFFSRDLKNGLTAEIIVRDGILSGRVLDGEFGEEFNIFRLEGVEGKFVHSVKNEYVELLEDIAKQTTYERLFFSDQANRLSEMIGKKYGAKPEFLWKKFPHFGVYRNAVSEKWFAIIMDLEGKKVSSDLSGEVEVMNVKLDDRVDEFVRKGAYPSYHMNKKSWVTIVLNDSLSDSLIAEMIDISFEKSEKKKKSVYKGV